MKDEDLRSHYAENRDSEYSSDASSSSSEESASVVSGSSGGSSSSDSSTSASASISSNSSVSSSSSSSRSTVDDDSSDSDYEGDTTEGESSVLPGTDASSSDDSDSESGSSSSSSESSGSESETEQTSFTEDLQETKNFKKKKSNSVAKSGKKKKVEDSDDDSKSSASESSSSSDNSSKSSNRDSTHSSEHDDSSTTSESATVITEEDSVPVSPKKQKPISPTKPTPIKSPLKSPTKSSPMKSPPKSPMSKSTAKSPSLITPSKMPSNPSSKSPSKSLSKSPSKTLKDHLGEPPIVPEVFSTEAKSVVSAITLDAAIPDTTAEESRDTQDPAPEENREEIAFEVGEKPMDSNDDEAALSPIDDDIDFNASDDDAPVIPEEESLIEAAAHEPRRRSFFGFLKRSRSKSRERETPNRSGSKARESSRTRLFRSKSRESDVLADDKSEKSQPQRVSSFLAGTTNNIEVAQEIEEAQKESGLQEENKGEELSAIAEVEHEASSAGVESAQLTEAQRNVLLNEPEPSQTEKKMASDVDKPKQSMSLFSYFRRGSRRSKSVEKEQQSKVGGAKSQDEGDMGADNVETATAAAKDETTAVDSKQKGDSNAGEVSVEAETVAKNEQAEGSQELLDEKSGEKGREKPTYASDSRDMTGLVDITPPSMGMDGPEAEEEDDSESQNSYSEPVSSLDTETFESSKSAESSEESAKSPESAEFSESVESSEAATSVSEESKTVVTKGSESIADSAVRSEVSSQSSSDSDASESTDSKTLTTNESEAVTDQSETEAKAQSGSDSDAGSEACIPNKSHPDDQTPSENGFPNDALDPKTQGSSRDEQAETKDDEPTPELVDAERDANTTEVSEPVQEERKRSRFSFGRKASIQVVRDDETSKQPQAGVDEETKNEEEKEKPKMSFLQMMKLRRKMADEKKAPGEDPVLEKKEKVTQAAIDSDLTAIMARRRQLADSKSDNSVEPKRKVTTQASAMSPEMEAAFEKRRKAEEEKAAASRPASALAAAVASAAAAGGSSEQDTNSEKYPDSDTSEGFENEIGEVEEETEVEFVDDSEVEVVEESEVEIVEGSEIEVVEESEGHIGDASGVVEDRYSESEESDSVETEEMSAEEEITEEEEEDEIIEEEYFEDEEESIEEEFIDDEEDIIFGADRIDCEEEEEVIDEEVGIAKGVSTWNHDYVVSSDVPLGTIPEKEVVPIYLAQEAPSSGNYETVPPYLTQKEATDGNHGTAIAIGVDRTFDENSVDELVSPNDIETGSSSSEHSKKGKEAQKGASRFQKKWLCLFCILVLIIGISAGIGLGFLFAKDDEDAIDDEEYTPTVQTTSPPSQAPTDIGVDPEIREEYLLVCSAYEDCSPLLDTKTPQGKAFQWLVEDNELLAFYEDHKKMQRYTLAAIFFSLGGESWFDSSNWLTNADECLWFSTAPSRACTPSKDFVALELDNNNVQGEIPFEVSLLKSLTSLSIQSTPGDEGSLKGAWPEALGDLVDLRTVNLSGNGFTGPIPDLIGNWPSLHSLNLSNNGFTGTVPVSFAGLSLLSSMNLAGNNITGVPSIFLSASRDLVELRLEDNKLSALPASIKGLSKLQNLNVARNALATFPLEVSELGSLTSLDLQANEIAKSIPTEIGKLLFLKSLYLNDNSLTGSIPTEIGRLVNLRPVLDLSSNGLSGKVPSEIGELIRLRKLYLDHNKLSGELPDTLSALDKIKEIRIDNNDLTGLVPMEVCAIYDVTRPASYADCTEIVSLCFNYCCTDGAGCKCRYADTDPLRCLA